jgi:hypothetical protein
MVCRARKPGLWSTCTDLANRNRGALSVTEQQGYIDAVWCLRGLPSVLPNEEYPGVRDRLDDFVAYATQRAE